MTREQAVTIAVEYPRSRPDLLARCRPEPGDPFLIPGPYAEAPGADFWIVHFPLMLAEGVASSPSTLGVTVDTVTGEPGVASLL